MGTATDMHALRAASERIRSMLEWPDNRLYAAPDPISAWSPAMHLQHVLLGCARFVTIIEDLESGRAPPTAGGPNLAGRAVLMTGWIPRGRGTAPEAMVPDAVPSRAHLRETCETACRSLLELASRSGGLQDVPGRSEHHHLGGLRATQWLRFARIHTEHHLAIIDDIDRRRSLAEALPDPAAPVGDTP